MSEKKSMELCPSPFSKSYWRQASLKKQGVKTLTTMALLVAAQIAISSFFIPVGENLRIFFSFLVVAVSAIVGGPWLALCSGLSSDLLGFIIHPQGAFFPGYTLSALLTALIFALFLYRARLTVVRLALCRLTLNLFVNALLGSIWSAMLYTKGFWVYLSMSLTKNILLLPLEVLLLVIILRILMPFLVKNRLTPPQPDNKIRFF